MNITTDINNSEQFIIINHDEDHNVSQTIGLKLSQLRQAAGLSQEEVASKMNVSLTKVVKIETGVNKLITIKQVSQYCKAIGATFTINILDL